VLPSIEYIEIQAVQYKNISVNWDGIMVMSRTDGVMVIFILLM
jgi:hypothetical protein